jgi:hypothetical protein
VCRGASLVPAEKETTDEIHFSCARAAIVFRVDWSVRGVPCVGRADSPVAFVCGDFLGNSSRQRAQILSSYQETPLARKRASGV